jgi:EAL domain-containing protein (putative c-di-GMP-specific phosphodiesterase class I)
MSRPPETAIAEVKKAALARAICGEVEVAFQPIADLQAKRVFGYEALARPLSKEFIGPADLFHTAASLGWVGELGCTFRKLAIQHCPDFPLFFNIYPNEFDEGYLVRPDDPIFRHRAPVYLEILEGTPVSHFQQCHGVLMELRGRGCLLAIDNLGKGYSNLKYIFELSPAIIKLDRELVTGVRHDTPRYNLLRGITRLCQDVGAKVVVQGVETIGELAVAQSVGAEYAQGYLIARPACPPPEIPRSSFF